MAFASVVELEEHRGSDFRPAQYPVAQRALDSATALIQNEARQHFVRVVSDVVTLHPQNGKWDAWLPELPVNAVTALTIGGLTVAVSGVEWTRYGRLRSKIGDLSNLYLGERDATGAPVVVVTYDHGYLLTPGEVPSPNPLGLRVLPPDIKTVCLRVAARAIGNPEGLAGESLGDYSRDFGEEGGAMLTADERRIVHRYRQKIA